ncbi:limonene-1,2-epoxide hydrolase family protein [Nocardioides sp. SYSU D00038]|uniref:limonene-1,2-epoxide hydrolase family protein n=1 Tax=Nocardioides sp. SYSU D00038 TaxID=2812554 RepID=UPI0019673EE7|nr:nuclear transport factor 2 family protein [Nocardioides sp. SYSU D00038]
MTALPADPVTRSPEEAVRGLWRTLSDRDYDGIAGWVTDDCIYLDVPVGPTLAARGPGDIAARLRVGWGELAGYENHDGLLVADGEHVIYEHSETWTFVSGEVLTLPFCSVHRVREGRVSLWKDYWDYGAVMSQAPASWVEGLATADTSWVFDATGLV